MSQPIAIFRHYPTEGPGTLADFLTRAGYSWVLIALDEGVQVPATARDFSGLVFMGGPMSVNDDLEWIEPELRLIREAVAWNIPVLGHCLGSQLMCKALGGVVAPNPHREIGWGAIQVADHALARHWFGAQRNPVVFHWHGETWSLPPGAQLLAGNEACAHQAFALGVHLGLQCHVEMTAADVQCWCAHGQAEIEANPGPWVQPAADILHHLEPRLQALAAVADQLYGVWLQGVRP